MSTAWGADGLCDSHAHLTSPELLPQAEAVLERARAAGVTRVMTVSSQRGDYDEVAAFAGSHDRVHAAVGLHPHEASAWSADEERVLRRAASRPEVVALGETGLDYHYDHSPRPAQLAAFRAQVRLARDLGLPLVIHSRNAEDDTASVLEEERADEVGGVLHCFSSAHRLAERCLDLGFVVSFSGIVTFPKSDALRESARLIPTGRLLVETDAPWLSPVPFRGKGANEPARLAHTAALVAELRGMTPAAFAAETNATFARVFLVGR